MTPRPPRPIRLPRGHWKLLRDQVCSTGGERWAACAACGTSRASEFLDAHHVYPRDLGGDDLAVNLVPLCDGGGGCHDVYERRLDGWRDVAAAIRRGWGAPFWSYLEMKRGSMGAAVAFADRYYPKKEAERAA